MNYEDDIGSKYKKKVANPMDLQNAFFTSMLEAKGFISGGTPGGKKIKRAGKNANTSQNEQEAVDYENPEKGTTPIMKGKRTESLGKAGIA